MYKRQVFEEIRRNGFVRVRVDGELHEATEEFNLEKNKKHTIEVVIDRIIVRPGVEKRLADSLETALGLTDGLIIVDVNQQEELLFNEKFACVDCGINFDQPSPRMFSFNNPFGACPECTGLGIKLTIDPDLVIPDPKKSLSEGAIKPWSRSTSRWYMGMLHSLSEQKGLSLDLPFEELPTEHKEMVLYGTGEEKIRFQYRNAQGRVRMYETIFEGVIPILERRFRETQSEYAKKDIESYMNSVLCPKCHGARLKPETLSVTVGGKNIYEVTRLSVGEALEFFNNLHLTEREQYIARQILKEIRSRLGFLVNVGLDYLNLQRSSGTLSGGEAQRIRLATQIGSSLMGVLYILDEPSIGLHQRDNDRLIETLKSLRDRCV